MCKEMLTTVHAAHIGVEGCIRRARETMYWPRMAAELKDYIAKCDVCLIHRASQGKENLCNMSSPDAHGPKLEQICAS